MGKEKMAKSKGGFLTLSELVERGYDPMDYRYYILGAHYRTQLGFGFEALDAARRARIRLDERVARLKEEAKDGLDEPPAPDEKAGGYVRSFEENVLGDLNMPRALSDLWGLLRDPDVAGVPKLAAIYVMDRVLGLNLKERASEQIELDEELGGLIEQRERARRNKEYERADAIRDTLLARGIVLEDTPRGVRWKRNQA